MNQLKDVKEFVIATGQPVLKLTDNISADRKRLRLNLIAEELLELASSFDTGDEGNQEHGSYVHYLVAYINNNYTKHHPYKMSGDKVEQLDALTDLLYVVNGTIIECGLEDVAEQAWNEVHRSNMSKILTKLDVAEIEAKNQSVNCHVEEVAPNKYVIRKDSDNKVVKPSTYYPANLRRILDTALFFLSKQKPLL